jgi:hypothetical protein
MNVAFRYDVKPGQAEWQFSTAGIAGLLLRLTLPSA